MGNKRTEAVKKSREKHDIVEIRFYVSQREKDKIRAFTEGKNKKLATYIKELIAEDMAKG